ATYFEPALQFYRAKGQQMPADVLTLALLDAYLSSDQYQKAVDLAAQHIKENPGNQQDVGAKLRNKIDELRTKKKYDVELKLIGQVKQMNPPLGGNFPEQFELWEKDAREHLKPKSSAG